mgnify:CR=1 FL=1
MILNWAPPPLRCPRDILKRLNGAICGGHAIVSERARQASANLIGHAGRAFAPTDKARDFHQVFDGITGTTAADGVAQAIVEGANACPIQGKL